jgi:hypothetical protein
MSDVSGINQYQQTRAYTLIQYTSVLQSQFGYKYYIILVSKVFLILPFVLLHIKEKEMSARRLALLLSLFMHR